MSEMPLWIGYHTCSSSRFRLYEQNRPQTTAGKGSSVDLPIDFFEGVLSSGHVVAKNPDICNSANNAA